MATTTKRTRPIIKEVSLSVLESRLSRAIRPKDRLWAMVRLADKLISKDSTHTERALILFSEAEQLAKSIGDRRGIAAAIHGASSCHLKPSNFATALELLERALPIAEQTGYAECEILILRDMGRVYIGQNRHDLALKTLQKCAEIAELIGNTRVQTTALNQTGIMLTHLGQYHEALECHKKSLALVEKGTDTERDQAFILGSLGTPLQLLGRYAEALSVFERSRQLFHTIQDTRNEGACQATIGVIYAELGDYPNALSAMSASAKILERADDRPSLAAVYANMMKVYLLSGNTEQTADFGEKALAVFEKIGDKRNLAATFMILGEYYLDRGQRTRAIQLLKRALALSQEIDSKDDEASALTLLAKIEIEIGKFTTSEKLLQDALAIANETGNRDCKVDVLLGLGNLFTKQSGPDRALPFLDRAVTIAEEIHSLRHKHAAHQMLAEALEAKEDFARALTHWKLASSIKEEMLGIEKQKAITAIQIQSNVEKLEKEKVLLNKEITLKSQQIERTTMDLAEKTELIRSTRRHIKEIVRPRSGTERSQLDQLLSELDLSLGGRKKILPNEFQLVHRNILQKLSKDYPALTFTERKVCVLLREGLSTKQMAEMLKVTTRAIEYHRYQIRKKLELGRETSLTTLLAGM